MLSHEVLKKAHLAWICTFLFLIGLCGCGKDYPGKYKQIKVGQTKQEAVSIMGEEPSEGKGIGVSEAVRVDGDGNRLDEDGNIIDPATLPEFYHWYDGSSSTIQIEVKDGKIIGKKKDGFVP